MSPATCATNRWKKLRESGSRDLPTKTADKMNTPADTTLQITRVIKAPRDHVHAASTDLELANQWWGPDGCETHELISDARPGGTTELRLTHEKLPSEQSRDNHIGGSRDELLASA